MPIERHEPPRTRVGAIPRADLGDYELFGEDGTPCREGDKPYRIVRKSDGKVLRPASWYPAEALNEQVYGGRQVCFVEEV